MLSSRSQSWPLARSIAAPGARAHPASDQRLLRWVLVASAFLCGLAVSGAIFAWAWRHESASRHAAQSRLGAQYARLATAGHELDRLALKLRRTEQTARTRARALTAQRQRIHVLTSAAARDRARLADAAAAASTAARTASTLAPEVKTLQGYLGSTPSLDAGYLQAQLAYLARQIDSLRAEVGRLSTSG